MSWIDALPLAELDEHGKCVVRVEGKQILVVRAAERVFAFSNRCPHEGFPLSEGECSSAGVLRCNWHNWTFDLVSGATLIGGDTLPQYPVRIENGRVFIEIAEPDVAAIRTRALDGVIVALDDADQSRLLREVVRLAACGADRDDAVRTAIGWLAPRLRYGTTHAIGGAADWLALAAATSEPDRQLAAYGEVLGHIADDGRRDGRYAYTEDVVPWDADAFLAAVEAGNEPAALALVHGARANGMTIAELAPVLARAALAHYADFGHSLIYVVKTRELIERIGTSAEGPLLDLLVRSLCVSTREDLLPEFRAYRAARAAWPAVAGTNRDTLTLPANVSVASALANVTAWSATATNEAMFEALVAAAAHALLHVDQEALTTTSGTIAKNVSWLDFTHALTFADAGQRAASIDPSLWPDVLLQIACFIGRSSAATDPAQDVIEWHIDDVAAARANLRELLFDHGRDRFIISVHLIKTLFAAERLIDGGYAEPQPILAALNRFMHAPMKGRHVIRTARQMLAVAAAT